MRFIKAYTLALSLLISSTCFAANTYSFPDKIDYADKANWAYLEIEDNKPVDVFFICPTVDMGQAGNLNADLNNAKYRNAFVGASNMERGIYDQVGRMIAPYYRQATFKIYSMSLDEQEKYLQPAYGDIREAFKYYMANYNNNRPVILAGFSQGADMTIRLLKEFYADKKYKDKLVAAYCIGWRLTKEEKKACPHLKIAKNEKDNGRMILFNSETAGIKESIMIPKNFKTYCVNPLNWKTNNKLADKKLNIGACFTDYSGKINKEIPQLTSAYIDKKRGCLVVPEINPKEYPAHIVLDGIFHVYDYQFFYRNLQANVKTRTEAYLKKHK